VKAWDVFPYWREQWAVDARLRLWTDLAPEVDYCPVALLGDRTHRGGPLLRAVTALPVVGADWLMTVLDAADDWGREAQQRDAVQRLRWQMGPDDLLLLCDADELVDPRALAAILAATETGPVKLRMANYMCGMRWRHRDWWRHPAACRARDLPEHPTADLRMNFSLPRVPDAGWHLTYLGTDADVDAKLSAFAHSELDTAQTRADIARIRAEGTGWIDDPLTGPLAVILAELLEAVPA
jgi:hypothetical protein